MSSMAHFCLPYSFVGGIFMLWVGMMIARQPFFLTGIDRNESKDVAFSTMRLFIAIFAASITYIVYESASQNLRGLNNNNDDYTPIHPQGMSTYQVSTTLEMLDESDDDYREMS